MANTSEKIVSKETAKELSSKMRTSLVIQNGIHLADRKRAPSLNLYEDADQYFDHNAYAIHLGIYGPLEIFGVETEEDYVAALEYLYGHENQHVRSTAKVPYANGIKRAMHAVIEFIAMKEGIRKNFRNDRDYEVFVETELPAHNIHINTRILMNICAGLLNSVCDGRIERIRSKEFPGFERERRYFRAKVWNRGEIEAKPFADLDAGDRLNIFMNGILSLATTGLYQKGFIVAYGNSPLLGTMQSFMPYIAKGVLATRTRTMADNAVEIAKKLAPYIYDVCKFDKAAADKAFEKLLASMIKQLLSQMDPDQLADTSERDEEQDDGVPMPVFPMSDLVITLDDETYDKLMEKAKQSGKGGAGLMIKREHPKEEEKKDGEEGSGSGSGNNSKDKSDKDGNGSGGSDGNKSDKDGNGNQSGNGQDGQSGQDSNQNGGEHGDGSNGSNGSASNSGGQNSKSGSDSNKSSAANDGEAKPYSKEYSKSEGGSSDTYNSKQGSHSAGGGRDGTLEMVMEQMQKAAKECREDVDDRMTSINRSVEHTAKTNRGRAPIVKDTDRPITAADVKDICSRGFKEVKRAYKLDEHLPPLLKSRADTFRKKNERYFRSLSTPNVSHLNSGAVDPSRIFGLAIGETDVFRKIGNDKKFDGCVYVLVDNSGSMAGNKRTEAAKAAAVIEEGFKGIIPMKIVAFDTNGPIIHEVIKGWDESQKLNCCWNFAKHGRSGCGNDDGKDIMVAQKELLSRSEEKKLLIVLSDGAPSSIEETKQAIDDTRKKGINVFGIYFEEGCIGSDAEIFKHMYTKDYVCCELAHVDETLTKLMIKFSRS